MKRQIKETNPKESGLGLDVKERAAKANGVANMLIQAGMNGGGFTPPASIRLYKAFIRPVLEYGMQLKLLD